MKRAVKSAVSGLSIPRRQVLAAAAGGALFAGTGCTARAVPLPPTSWVGAHHDRGHRLRTLQQATRQALPPPAVQRRAAVLVVGAGIAGLAAARAFARQGVDDVHLLELEDGAGGNSRGHTVAGMGCPLGAHYLPLPGPDAVEVAEWLHEIGLLRHEFGRSVPDERHLCHSPQERVFVDGAWAEGLLPPAAAASPQMQQARRLAQAITRLQAGSQGRRAFTLPAHRGVWTPAHAALNGSTFATWLDGQGIVDSRLRWYLDYCCRDDYGAAADAVSAAAGVAYFASRHGFHVAGDGRDSAVADEERDPVFTWPEGNAWLAQRLAAPFADTRLHSARTVLRVTESRHGVQVLAWDERRQHVEAWTAPQVVLALPLFVAARVLESPPQALRDAAALLHYAPWLVANLHIDKPLLDRPGMLPCWDNVVFGSSALGYVDAMHQSLRASSGPTVLTAYHALQHTQRAALLAPDPAPWAEQVLQDLAAAHPDIRRRVQRIDLMRWGHGMAVPLPGVLRHPALQALRSARGRVRFAHADLAGYSVFEEAFTAGCEVARAQPPVMSGVV